MLEAKDIEVEMLKDDDTMGPVAVESEYGVVIVGPGLLEIVIGLTEIAMLDVIKIELLDILLLETGPCAVEDPAPAVSRLAGVIDGVPDGEVPAPVELKELIYKETQSQLSHPKGNDDTFEGKEDAVEDCTELLVELNVMEDRVATVLGVLVKYNDPGDIAGEETGAEVIDDSGTTLAVMEMLGEIEDGDPDCFVLGELLDCIGEDPK